MLQKALSRSSSSSLKEQFHFMFLAHEISLKDSTFSDQEEQLPFFFTVAKGENIDNLGEQIFTKTGRIVLNNSIDIVPTKIQKAQLKFYIKNYTSTRKFEFIIKMLKSEDQSQIGKNLIDTQKYASEFLQKEKNTFEEELIFGDFKIRSVIFVERNLYSLQKLVKKYKERNEDEPDETAHFNQHSAQVSKQFNSGDKSQKIQEVQSGEQKVTVFDSLFTKPQSNIENQQISNQNKPEKNEQIINQPNEHIVESKPLEKKQQNQSQEVQDPKQIEHVEKISKPNLKNSKIFLTNNNEYYEPIKHHQDQQQSPLVEVKQNLSHNSKKVIKTQLQNPIKAPKKVQKVDVKIKQKQQVQIQAPSQQIHENEQQQLLFEQRTYFKFTFRALILILIFGLVFFHIKNPINKTKTPKTQKKVQKQPKAQIKKPSRARSTRK